MSKKLSIIVFAFTALLMSANFVSCSKDSTPPPPTDPCAGKSITVSTATTIANCSNNGSITVIASGSTGFTFKLNAGGSYQASNVFSNLAAGAYTIFVKDGAGCEKTSPVTVSSSTPITVNGTSTPATNCVNNGTITVTATGGTSFTYKLGLAGTYQVSNVFTNLAAGSYTVFAKENAGCEISTTVTVNANNSIVVTATTVSASKCSNNGTITVNASGSSGFTYKLEAGGVYQASSLFIGLAAGNYTMFAKDAFGCEKSVAVTVSINNTAGPLFTNVKNLLAARCVSCHSGPSPAGGHNWTIDCEIVNFSDRINQRAVVIGDMPQGGPPLTAAEKAIITNWITAGAKFTN